MTKTQKRPVGRPSKYLPEYCQLLIEHQTKGFSFESFAAVVDTTKDTLYNWLKEHPDFLDARKHADEKCRLFWEQQGMIGLMQSKDGPMLNTTNWIFQMKNRFRWTDKQELTGADGAPIQMQMAVANLTPEQVKVMAQKVLELASDPDLQED